MINEKKQLPGYFLHPDLLALCSHSPGCEFYINFEVKCRFIKANASLKSK